MSSKPGLRLQFLRAGLVGLVAGGVAVVFLLLVQLTENLRIQALAWAHGHILAALLLVLACAAVASFAGDITAAFAPEAAGSGIPHVKAVLQYLRVMRYRRVLPVKFLGGLLALGSGLRLAHEGPTVQAALDAALTGKNAYTKFSGRPKAWHRCGSCSVTYWRRLMAIGRRLDEPELTARVKPLKGYRTGDGRYRRFPFW